MKKTLSVLAVLGIFAFMSAQSANAFEWSNLNPAYWGNSKCRKECDCGCKKVKKCDPCQKQVTQPCPCSTGAAAPCNPCQKQIKQPCDACDRLQEMSR